MWILGDSCQSLDSVSEEIGSYSPIARISFDILCCWCWLLKYDECVDSMRRFVSGQVRGAHTCRALSSALQSVTLSLEGRGGILVRSSGTSANRRARSRTRSRQACPLPLIHASGQVSGVPNDDTPEYSNLPRARQYSTSREGRAATDHVYTTVYTIPATTIIHLNTDTSTRHNID